MLDLAFRFFRPCLSFSIYHTVFSMIFSFFPLPFFLLFLFLSRLIMQENSSRALGKSVVGFTSLSPGGGRGRQKMGKMGA